MGVLVGDSLCSNRVKFNLGSIENTAVRINKAAGSIMNIISVYLRPQDSLSLNDFDPILDQYSREGLIVGDELNAKHSY